MINLSKLKEIKRIDTKDSRNFKLGIRADRNEKVEDWPLNIFKNIFKNIKAHEFTAYYNTGDLKKLNQKIGKFLKVSEKNFVINHGGDGVIRDFLLINYKKNLKVALNGNNYEMYKVYLRGLDVKFFESPYKINLEKKNIFELDQNAFYKNLIKSDIIFFTNPNQVSNYDLSIKKISSLCKKYSKKLFFIDESYYGFGHYSFINLSKKYKNIFILRSVTKTFGLASARIGFLISHSETIKAYKALQTPYPVSLYGGKCLEFFLQNIKIVKNYNQNVKKGRDYFCNKLKEDKYLVSNGGGLSVLIFFKLKKNLNKIYNKLLKNRIYTKKMQINSSYFLRITCAPKNTMNKILKYF